MVFRDLKGERFGRLIVLGLSHRNKNQKLCWHAQCDCGTKVVVLGPCLTIGHTRSCGCLRREMVTNNNYTHMMHATAIYRVWSNMLQRCSNPKIHNYAGYGGRGIKVCDRWLSFENFYADMGEKPQGLQIDRINNDGNYEFDNCKWANRIEQANNRRDNVVINHNGYSLTIAQWERKLFFKKGTLKSRLLRGWPLKRAMVPV